jgi:hypothetical protein
MAKKENTEKPLMVEKLKLFNSMTRETVLIADEDSAKYDARLWQIVEKEIKTKAIRLEDIAENRHKEPAVAKKKGKEKKH